MMYRLIASSVILNLFILLGLNTASAADQYRHARRINELVKPLIESGILPAVTIGVVDRGTHWIGNYGKLSEDDPKPPNDRTIYEIGSITKVFTGILLAHSVAAGEVEIATTIGSIAESAREHNPEVGNSIQLWHLATHSSGLPRMPTNFQPVNPLHPYVDYDRRLMLEFLHSVRLEKSPGKPSGYSNYGLGLLGELLAMKAGTTYSDLLKQRITVPLKMKDTSISVLPDARLRLAPPHQADGSRGEEWEFDALAGAGAIRSTSRDMLRFIDAHLKLRKDPLGAAIELAWHKHLPGEGNGFAMGLGWHIAGDGTTRWHNGQTGGFHSILFVNRPLQAGVIVLSNSAAADVETLGEQVMRLIAGNEVQPLDVGNATVDPKVLARLAGRYQLEPDFILEVSAKGGRLFAQATGQPQFRLIGQSNTKWTVQGVDATLEFELPQEGQASSVVLHQNGASPKADRIQK